MRLNGWHLLACLVGAAIWALVIVGIRVLVKGA